MYKQIYKLRKILKISQEKFGEGIGVTGAAVSRMEKGLYNITESMIKLICSVYAVDEVWLRTGEGDPFPADNDLDKEKALIIDDILHTNNLLKLSFYNEIKKMNQAQLDVLREIIKSFSKLIE